MARLSAWAAAFGLLVVAAAPPASADRESCRQALSSYNVSRQAQADNLQRYARCLELSRGQDDCTTQFTAMRRQQFDFVVAVTRHRQECGEY